MLHLQFLLGVWLTAFATTDAEGVRPVVTTSSGKVQGVVTNVKGINRKVHTYRGVPFAKSPVGKLRFSAPQPLERWTNVRDASRFPPVCTQAPAGIAFQNYLFSTIAPNVNTSEDCLFLNIHAPEPAGLLKTKKPVLVWLHGGALIFGGASIYDGSSLAANEDVVVVVPQYRLGVPGFLSTGDKEAPGNWGILDQIAALQWVQKEISCFGGDPNSVTIYGQSAGGASVGVLMVSPMAKGLFHRAIAESGTGIMAGMVNTDKQSAVQFRDAIAQATGCSRSTSAEIVACLRKKTAEELNMPVASGAIPFLPIVVDGVVLPKSPQQLMADKAMNKVPMIIGYNNDECGFWVPTLFGLQSYENGITQAEIPGYLLHYQSLMGPPTPEMSAVLMQYVGDMNDPIKVRDGILKMCTDLMFRIPAQTTADYVRSTGQKAYVYEFQHRSSLGKGILPTYVDSDHGQEIAFVFGQPFLMGDVRVNGNFTVDEQSLSRKTMKQWASFARTGNPNGNYVQEWSAWDEKKSYQKIDIKTKSG